jgi:multiple sugar transport system substrate-binding protein
MVLRECCAGTALGAYGPDGTGRFRSAPSEPAAIAGGFDTDHLKQARPTINTDAGLRAAEFLLEPLRYSPPGSCRCHGPSGSALMTGNIAMAYVAIRPCPYFEQDENKPSRVAGLHAGYRPHPSGPPNARRLRRWAAFLVFPPILRRTGCGGSILSTFQISPAAQKPCVQNGAE